MTKWTLDFEVPFSIEFTSFIDIKEGSSPIVSKICDLKYESRLSPIIVRMVFNFCFFLTESGEKDSSFSLKKLTFQIVY